MKLNMIDSVNGIVAPEHRGMLVHFKTGEVIRPATDAEYAEAEQTQSGRGQLMGPILDAEDWDTMYYVTRRGWAEVAGVIFDGGVKDA